MPAARRLCLLSSIPATLWTFYRPLLAALPGHGFEAEIVCSSGPQATLLREELGLVVHEVALPRAITPLQDGRAVARLALLFHRGRYDLVHAHTPKAVLLAMIAATVARVPNRVCTLHGLPLETERGVNRNVLWLTEKLSLALSHEVLVVSPSLRQSVVDKGLAPPERLTVLGHGSALGVDLRRFRPDPARREAARRGLGIAGGDTVVGFVARLVPDKGVELLAEMFTDLLGRPGLRLLVVGDFEPHRGAVSGRAAEFIRRHPKVIHVPHSETVEELFAAMDLLVLPTAREGFGAVLLEAAATGLPVVASRVTGCVDAVSEGSTGLLFRAGDRGEFEAAVRRLLDDGELRRSMGEAGRARAERLFDSGARIADHVALYNRLCGRSSRRGAA